MSFLPPSTNADYRGSVLAVWFLALAGLLTLGPGLVHSVLPDGGVGTIAGLDAGAAGPVVLAVFRWQGATQIALGLAMLIVAWRYRSLTPVFLALLALETGLSAVQAWVVAAPAGHRPPEHYGALATAPLAVVFLVLSLRRRSPRSE